MMLFGIVGGVEVLILVTTLLIGITIYLVSREKSQKDMTHDSEKRAEIR